VLERLVTIDSDVSTWHDKDIDYGVAKDFVGPGEKVLAGLPIIGFINMPTMQVGTKYGSGQLVLTKTADEGGKRRLLFLMDEVDVEYSANESHTYTSQSDQNGKEACCQAMCGLACVPCFMGNSAFRQHCVPSSCIDVSNTLNSEAQYSSMHETSAAFCSLSVEDSVVSAHAELWDKTKLQRTWGTFDDKFAIDVQKTDPLITLTEHGATNYLCGVCACIPVGPPNTPLEMFGWNIEEAISGTRDTTISKLYSNTFGSVSEGGSNVYGTAERQQSARFRTISIIYNDPALGTARTTLAILDPSVSPKDIFRFTSLSCNMSGTTAKGPVEFIDTQPFTSVLKTKTGGSREKTLSEMGASIKFCC